MNAICMITKSCTLLPRLRWGVLFFLLFWLGTNALALSNYDSLGRLIRDVAPNGTVITYTYDEAGNITAMTSAAAGSPGAPAVLTSDPAPFGYLGSAFSYKLVSSKTPATFTATGLPPGLVLTGSTGIIAGRPTVVGSYPVTVNIKVGLVITTTQMVIQVRPARKAPTILRQPEAQMVVLGQSATLFVNAVGTGPLAFQWRKNGANIAGATQASYSIASFSSTDVASYTVVVSNAVGAVVSAAAALSKAQPLAVNGEAFGLPVTFTSAPTGAPPWALQSAVTWGGRPTLQSGAIGNSSSTSFETTLTGPGVFTFRWKVSSEASRDQLIFFLDGSSRAVISGEQDWQQQTWQINSGSHTLKWMYSKSSSGTAGQDKAWVADAGYVPGWSLATPIVGGGSVTRSPSAGTYANGAAVRLTAVPEPGWKFSRWTGSNTGTTAALSVSMTAHKSVTATFIEIVKYSATATASPLEGGTTTGTGVYNTGSKVTVKATPAPGWFFANWTEAGKVVSTAATYAYTATKSRGLVANFVRPANITSHAANANLGTSPVTFTWDTGYGATEYWLYVGNRPGYADLYNGSQALALSRTVTLPTDGRRIYVTLRSKINGVWMVTSTSYFSGAGPVVLLTQPVSKIVAIGTGTSFSASTSGALLQTYVWRKNGVGLAGGNGTTYSIASTGLVHAGTYTFSATNAAGTVTSAPALLGVVDTANKDVSVIEGATIALTASASGTGLSYAWKFGSTTLANGGRTAGANTYRLTMTKATKADEGTYSCLVTNAGGSLVAGTRTLKVISKPTVTAPAPPSGIVSGNFQWQLTGTESPTKYVVSGLPSGLTLNATTGLVSGLPNVSTSNLKVKVTAYNAAGASPTVEYSLNIAALPAGTTGSFSGWLTRVNSVNSALGGHVTLTVLSTGTFSGVVRNGAATYSIKTGRLVAPLSGNPTSTVTIPVTGGAALTLNLTFAGATNTVTGTLTNGSGTSTLNARRHVWVGTSAAAYAGRFNTLIALPSGSVGNAAQPQGHGWQQLTVAATGTVSVAGCTLDGIGYTFSGTLWPDGSLPEFILTHGNNGSINGLPRIVLGAQPDAHRVSGWVEHYKRGPSSTADRTYAGGIPLLRLTVDGSLYIAPTTTSPIILGLPDAANNAHLFYKGGQVESTALYSDLDQLFRISRTNVAAFPAATAGNPCKVYLSIVPSTGMISGGYTLTDTVSGKVVYRTVLYRGALISHKRRGYGNFQLPGLTPSTATSSILSGNVELY